jgi:hypothetical protein
MQQTEGSLVQLVEKSGCDTGIFEGLRVVKEPSLLDNYSAVIVDCGWLDANMIDALERVCRRGGRVLLHGALDRDAWARRGRFSIAESLASRNLLFNHGVASRLSRPDVGIIDLEGIWDWSFTGPGPAQGPVKPPANVRWETMRVPGMWGETAILGSLKYRKGDAWYRKTITVPQNREGRSLTLEFGAIDDFDWVFINGVLIGKTGQERANWWTASRHYPIPRDVIRWGQPNEIYVCVRNADDDGGIWMSPARITSTGSLVLRWRGREKTGKNDPVRTGPLATILDKDAIRADAQVLAEVGQSPAFVKQGNWYWWIGDTAWKNDDSTDEAVIKTFLSAEQAEHGLLR